jgi:hypothetical protein
MEHIKYFVVFIPPRLSHQPNTTSLEESVFMAIYCGREQQTALRSSRKVLCIFVRFQQNVNFSKNFHKRPNIKLQLNLSNGSRVDTEKQAVGETDRYDAFANAPKKEKKMWMRKMLELKITA